MEICSDNELDELKILKKLYFSQNIIKVHSKTIFESTFWEVVPILILTKKRLNIFLVFPALKCKEDFPIILSKCLQKIILRKLHMLIINQKWFKNTSHVDIKSTKLNAKLTLRNKCGFALAFFVPFFVYLGLALKY